MGPKLNQPTSPYSSLQKKIWLGIFFVLRINPSNKPSSFSLQRIHARTELGFQDPGTGWIPPSPLVQFKLYQGEVLPYNPGTRDWVESTQSETPQAPTQSVRGKGRNFDSMKRNTDPLPSFFQTVFATQQQYSGWPRILNSSRQMCSFSLRVKLNDQTIQGRWTLVSRFTTSVLPQLSPVDSK